MIKVVKNSDIDNENLSSIKIQEKNDLEGFDFSGWIVNKPWGYEYLMYETPNSSIWALHINKESLTSMHCHLHKKTALFVLSGEVIFSTLGEKLNLKEGNGVILDKKVFHSTKAISENGAIVMEIESPSKKEDLVRLSDSYGRELKGYELKKEMTRNKDNYKYINFSKNDLKLTKNIGAMSLSIEEFNDNNSLRENLRKFADETFIILSGKLINKKENKVFQSGDIFRIENKDEIESIEIIGEVKVLKIIKNNG